jgi:hypothetical protein
LYVGKVWNITSFNQLKNLLSTLNWEVRVEGGIESIIILNISISIGVFFVCRLISLGDWLGNMLKINATSFCDYLKLFQGIIAQVQDYPEFKFKLPFSGIFRLDCD